MKAIIYLQESTANEALAACSAEILQGEVQHEGEGPFISPDLGKPYTTIIKHPTQAKWALIADEQVENLLGETALELDSTWFPRSVLSASALES